jgi:hypothetical protein
MLPDVRPIANPFPQHALVSTTIASAADLPKNRSSSSMRGRVFRLAKGLPLPTSSPAMSQSQND